MKRHVVLLVAMLAVTAAPLLSSPAFSSPGSPATLGNHNISIQKLTGTNITSCLPAGPFVMGNGHTATFTNNTLNTVQVSSYNAANAVIASSALLVNGQSHQFTQSTGASEISYFIVTDNSKTTTRVAVNYAAFPGLGGPGLAALAILLMGSAAWALTRKRGESAV